MGENTGRNLIDGYQKHSKAVIGTKFKGTKEVHTIIRRGAFIIVHAIFFIFRLGIYMQVEKIYLVKLHSTTN